MINESLLPLILMLLLKNADSQWHWWCCSREKMETIIAIGVTISAVSLLPDGNVTITTFSRENKAHGLIYGFNISIFICIICIFMHSFTLETTLACCLPSFSNAQKSCHRNCSSFSTIESSCFLKNKIKKQPCPHHLSPQWFAAFQAMFRPKKI